MRYLLIFVIFLCSCMDIENTDVDTRIISCTGDQVCTESFIYKSTIDYINDDDITLYHNVILKLYVWDDAYQITRQAERYIEYSNDYNLIIEKDLVKDIFLNISRD